ncbi:phage tail protein [Clostridium botulinum]
MEQFYTLLTDIGKAKIANATALQKKLELSKIVLGDSKGTYYEPTEQQTQLKNKVWEGEISDKFIDKDNPNWIVVQTIIPSQIGGFTIREAGIIDNEGDLVLVAKYPETYKPKVENGSTKDITINLILEVSNVENVTLKVDPTIIFATKKDIENVQKNLEQNIKNIESQVKPFKNTAILEEESNRAKIGISEFNMLTDELLVYQNGIYIEKDKEYKISLDGLYIEKIGGNWNKDTIFNFVMYKGVKDKVAYEDGSLILNESITLNKLNLDIQNKINSIDEKLNIDDKKELENKISSINAEDIKTSSGNTVELQLADIATQQGELKNLKTTNKTNLVNAVNELFTSASNGKKLISDVVGNPLLANDSFRQQHNKIQALKNIFASNLNNKGQSGNNTESLQSLINKVAYINTGKRFITGKIYVSDIFAQCSNGKDYVEKQNFTQQLDCPFEIGIFAIDLNDYGISGSNRLYLYIKDGFITSEFASHTESGFSQGNGCSFDTRQTTIENTTVNLNWYISYMYKNNMKHSYFNWIAIEN